MKRKSESGQVTLEAILLTSIVVLVVIMISNFARNNQLLSSFVRGPWLHLQGMAEAGVWAPPQQAKAAHPNNFSRHGTVRGTDVP